MAKNRLKNFQKLPKFIKIGKNSGKNSSKNCQKWQKIDKNWPPKNCKKWTPKIAKNREFSKIKQNLKNQAIFLVSLLRPKMPFPLYTHKWHLSGKFTEKKIFKKIGQKLAKNYKKIEMENSLKKFFKKLAKICQKFQKNVKNWPKIGQKFKKIIPKN